MVVLFAVGVEGSSIAEFGLGELVCVCEVFSITVCVVLFDANCDTAPLAPVSLIRLNHKTSHQVLYIYVWYMYIHARWICFKTVQVLNQSSTYTSHFLS